MGEPKADAPAIVSVVIPVWNAEPWLRQCLDSVIGQTIGLDRMEIIAVDDGSTDGSGAILRAYASQHPQLTAIGQANSGGPGGPRNAGTDRARGTYVFYLDADDYLGAETLERMVAMAERNGSDIVVGKMVGVDGRKDYSDTGVFSRNVDRADPQLVYPSGNVLKLFRRSFLARAGLRFPDGVAGGEDGDFMARAYLEAETISIVADYPCYYARRREGSQTVRADRQDDLAAYIERIERNRIQVVAARRRPGPGRDRLLRRHFSKIAAKFRARWLAQDPAERRRAFDAGSRVVRRWYSARIAAALPAWAAIRIHCLRHGLVAELEDIAAVPPRAAYRDPFVERGRVFARFPHFRDAARIPDRCFDLTDELVPQVRLDRAAIAGQRLEISGHAYIRHLGGTTTIVLRRWPGGPELRFATSTRATPLLRDKMVPYPMAGFDVEIDLRTASGGKPLRDGTWALHLVLTSGAVRRRLALRAGRGAAAVVLGRGPGTGRAALRRAPGGELRLRVGRRSSVLPALERVDAARSGVARKGRRALRRIRRLWRVARPGG